MAKGSFCLQKINISDGVVQPRNMIILGPSKYSEIPLLLDKSILSCISLHSVMEQNASALLLQWFFHCFVLSFFSSFFLCCTSSTLALLLMLSPRTVMNVLQPPVRKSEQANQMFQLKLKSLGNYGRQFASRYLQILEQVLISLDYLGYHCVSVAYLVCSSP